MELIKVGEKTYYIKNATNIGVYKIDENIVYLIDSGNDKILITDRGTYIYFEADSSSWTLLYSYLSSMTVYSLSS